MIIELELLYDTKLISPARIFEASVFKESGRGLSLIYGDVFSSKKSKSRLARKVADVICKMKPFLSNAFE